MTAQDWVYFFLAVSAISLIVAFFFARQVIGSDQGTPDRQKIAGTIRRGAEALLNRPYRAAGGPPGPFASHIRPCAANTRAEAKPT